jgi:hypothetical protein
MMALLLHLRSALLLQSRGRPNPGLPAPGSGAYAATCRSGPWRRRDDEQPPRCSLRVRTPQTGFSAASRHPSDDAAQHPIIPRRGLTTAPMRATRSVCRFSARRFRRVLVTQVARRYDISTALIYTCDESCARRRSRRQRHCLIRGVLKPLWRRTPPSARDIETRSSRFGNPRRQSGSAGSGMRQPDRE